MAAWLQAFCLALNFVTNIAAYDPQSGVNSSTHDRIVAAEKSKIWSVFPSKILQLQPVCKASSIIQCTPDRLHYQHPASHCQHPAHYTKLPVGVHPIWLNIKLTHGSHRSSKFGKARVNYVLSKLYSYI